MYMSSNCSVYRAVSHCAHPGWISATALIHIPYTKLEASKMWCLLPGNFLSGKPTRQTKNLRSMMLNRCSGGASLYGGVCNSSRIEWEQQQKNRTKLTHQEWKKTTNASLGVPKEPRKIAIFERSTPRDALMGSKWWPQAKHGQQCVKQWTHSILIWSDHRIIQPAGCWKQDRRGVVFVQARAGLSHFPIAHVWCAMPRCDCQRRRN